jgi:hypothetical protein
LWGGVGRPGPPPAAGAPAPAPAVEEAEEEEEEEEENDDILRLNAPSIFLMSALSRLQVFTQPPHLCCASPCLTDSVEVGAAVASCNFDS